VVKELQRNGKTFYVCEACGFLYEQKRWAQKCQEWDEEHQTCNLEIIQHGVPPENGLGEN
jgi:hypothetical protein